jgi:hypothetical protein
MKYLVTVAVLLTMLVGCKKGDNAAPAENTGDNAAAESSGKEHHGHGHRGNWDGGTREHHRDGEQPASK